MVTAVTGLLVFLLFLAFNWWRARSLLDPAVAMSSVWAATFLILATATDQYYAVSWSALLIYICGLAMFSFGVMLGNAFPLRQKAPNAYGYRNDRISLWLLFIILILGMPFYLSFVRQFTNVSLLSPTFFLQIREAMLEQSRNLARVPLLNNLVVLSSISAIVGFAVTDSGRYWRILVVGLLALAGFYNLLTGAKSGLVNLVVMLFAIYCLQRNRIPKLAIFGMVGMVLVIFGIVTVQRQVSIGGDIGSVNSVLRVTWDQFRNYLEAGPVGFSVYLKHPGAVPAVWSPWRFFEHTANYFGRFYDVPDLNAAYVKIGDGLNYNVYTAYFSYFPAYGVSGVAGFMLVLGVIAGAAYRRARQQRLLWQLLYASIFYGILMTIFNESLLLALNPTIKLLVVAGGVVFLRRIRLRGQGKYVEINTAKADF